MGLRKKATDQEMLFWDGEAINGMSREALKKALIDANVIIENQKDTIYNLRKSVSDMENL